MVTAMSGPLVAIFYQGSSETKEALSSSACSD